MSVDKCGYCGTAVMAAVLCRRSETQVSCMRCCQVCEFFEPIFFHCRFPVPSEVAGELEARRRAVQADKVEGRQTAFVRKWQRRREEMKELLHQGVNPQTSADGIRSPENSSHIMEGNCPDRPRKIFQ